MFSFFWTRSASVPAAILYILLGLVLAIYPGFSGTVFVWLLAAATLLFALVRLTAYLKFRRRGISAPGDLAAAVITGVLGIFFLTSPRQVLSFLPLVLGLLFLVDGVGKLPLLMEARKAKVPVSTPLLLSVMVPLVLGVVMLANSFGVVQMMIRVFGIGLLIDGILDLVTCLTDAT